MKILLHLLCLFFVVPSLIGQWDIRDEKKTVKALILIIASDEQPIYRELQNVWRSYMHTMRSRFECYFIKANPQLSSDYEIREDVIWCKTTETVVPGMLDKTLLALQAFLPRIKNEFNFVLRTNLSSFYIFSRLATYLNSLPSQKCYSGSPHRAFPFASGSGFILSPDLAELLVDHKAELFNRMDLMEDVQIGKFMQEHGIRRIPHDRVDILSLDDWKKYKRRPTRLFHIRVKFENPKRLDYEVTIRKNLVGLFYNKSELTHILEIE